MNDLDIKVIDEEQEQTQFKKTFKANPWDGVLFLAKCGRMNDACELQKKLVQDISDEKKELQDRLQEIQDKLSGPTLTDGVLLNGPDDKNRFIIGVNGRRFDVDMFIDPVPSHEEFQAGREIWVNPESFAIIKLKNSYVQGEIAPIIDIISSPETAKKGHDKESDNDDEEKKDHPKDNDTHIFESIENGNSNNALIKYGKKDQFGDTGQENATQNQSNDGQHSLEKEKRLFLQVKSRQEEIVVEAIPALVQKQPKVGDTVRIISSLGVALDLLSRGRKDVLLSEIPDVNYNDIGGLDIEIAQIRESIEEPYVYPQLFQRYNLNRPRGILLYGPPGCGKTMIAKAIANNISKQIELSLNELQVVLELYTNIKKGLRPETLENLLQAWFVIRSKDEKEEVFKRKRNLELELFQKRTDPLKRELEGYLRGRGLELSRVEADLQDVIFALEQGSQSYFVSIKGPELLSKWVGETESSIRGIFAMARERATFYTPVVLFFDELESMFSRRGSGISSDVQKTIVPQLLAEIDGIEETRNVIIIGASNRFDLIDPAVLRPGRLDLKIKIPRPNRHRDALRSIFNKYLTEAVPLSPDELRASRSSTDPIEKVAIVDRFASLDDNLTAYTTLLAEESKDTKAAIFLLASNNSHASAEKLPVLKTAIGINSDRDRKIIEYWLDNDGIVKTTFLKGKVRQQKKDPAFIDRKMCSAAWPIVQTYSLSQVLGVLVVSHAGSKMSKPLILKGEKLAKSITLDIALRHRTVDRLIERLIDVIFHEKSRLIITEKTKPGPYSSSKPRVMQKKVREIVSGAMASSVVSRAKRAAVKREILNRTFGKEGVRWDDLYKAVRKECEEGKDQYIYEFESENSQSHYRGYRDTERYIIDVELIPMDETRTPPTILTNKRLEWKSQST